MNYQAESRKIRLTTWVKYLVVFALGCILVSYFVIAILRAREAALRTQCANNLKQIALSFHNFHDTQKKFPPGGSLDSEGRQMHGWPTHILPYLEASPLYSYIDKDLPWDDPLNQHAFRFPYPHSYRSPLIPIDFTASGYALIHYSANQNMFGLNSRVRFEDLSGETSHTWMVQELYDQWHPWGATLNFSDLNWPTRHFRKNLTWSGGGLQMVMADGSVVFLDPKTGLDRIEKLRNMQRGLIKPPSHSESSPVYSYSGPQWHHEHYSLPKRDKVDAYMNVIKNAEGKVKFAQISSGTDVRYKKAINFVDSTVEELEAAIEIEPTISSLMVLVPLDMKSASALTALQKLEYLEVGEFRLAEDEIVILSKLPKLKTIVCRCTEEQKKVFERKLPGFNIRPYQRKQ